MKNDLSAEQVTQDFTSGQNLLGQTLNSHSFQSSQMKLQAVSKDMFDDEDQ